MQVAALASRAVDVMPGLVLVVVGLLVLAGRRGIADVFTAMQQQHRLYAHPSARPFQQINTLLFGLTLTAIGLALVFGWV